MTGTAEESLARAQHIMETVQQLGPMLVGTLLTKHNRKRRQDGSQYVSEPYYTFQYRNKAGRRCWKRIPRKQKEKIRKLVETGKRYGQLEREYTRLMTELGMSDVSKKKD